MKKLFFLIILVYLLPKPSLGQQFFRIKAEFSIKEKRSTGSSMLTMGTVYYDKQFKKIVYDIHFPEKQTWVSIDTNLYLLKEGKLIERRGTISTTDFSIFHLALNGELENFGIENNPVYDIDKVEKDGGMVLTTWTPDARVKHVFGEIVMSHVDKKLNGVVFFDPKGKILAKQFFKEYVNLRGMVFPTSVIQFHYNTSDQGENKQITTYKNIILDDLKNEELYDYPIPM